MNSPQEAFAHAIEAANRLVMMLTEDLKPSECLHRPTPKANCAAWIVGHLILSARGMAKRLGATDLPPLPDGFEKRFARDDAAPFAADYGDVSGLRTLLDQSHALLAQAARALPAAKVNEPLDKPHPMFGTLGGVAAFAPIHIATHAGQISTIRRSLGRAPLV